MNVTKQDLVNLAILVVWLLSAIAMLIRVYSLRFNTVQNPALFWLPYLLFVSTSAWVALTKKDRGPLYIALCMSFVLNLIIQVWWPGDFLAGVDAPHHVQIASRIIETGHLAPGYPGFTGEAFNYSFYPGLDLFLSSFSMLTAIPLATIYQYTFTILNLLTLVFVYIVMTMFFGKGSKVVDLGVFLYALSPRLHSFNNAAVSESLAIIFFPLLISVFILDSDRLVYTSKKWVVILAFLVFTVFTHHWTMYMLVLQAAVIVLGTFVLTRKVSRARTNMFLIAIALLGAWLFFILNSQSLHWTTTLIRALLTQLGGRQLTLPAAYSMPLSERYLTYAGVGIFLLTSLLGVYQLGRSRLRAYDQRIKNLPLILWWATCVALIAFFELISWRSTTLVEAADIRFRNLEFAYFGVAVLSAVGILFVQERFTKRLCLPNLSRIVDVLLILVIAVPTVTLGFQYYVYDKIPVKSSDGAVAFPEESYASCLWLKRHTENEWIAAPFSEFAYISGHAQLNFSYEGYVNSVKQRDVLMRLYSVNKALLQGPDEVGFVLTPEDVAWMDATLNRAYDNGALTTYSAP
jgi:hypothetical protein